MSYPRDTQRTKLYQAEKALHTDAVPQQIMLAFATKVLRSSKMKAAIGVHSPALHDQGTSCLCKIDRDGTVIVPDWFTYRAQFLHGLAHIVSPPSDTAAWHGPAFCRAYMDLVRRFLDVEAAATLRTAFKDNKVKARVVSQESRDAARERFMARKAEALEGSLRKLAERFSE